MVTVFVLKLVIGTSVITGYRVYPLSVVCGTVLGDNLVTEFS